jgi:hypothetical protein
MHEMCDLQLNHSTDNGHGNNVLLWSCYSLAIQVDWKFPNLINTYSTRSWRNLTCFGNYCSHKAIIVSLVGGCKTIDMMNFHLQQCLCRTSKILFSSLLFIYFFRVWVLGFGYHNVQLILAFLLSEHGEFEKLELMLELVRNSPKPLWAPSSQFQKKTSNSCVGELA